MTSTQCDHASSQTSQYADTYLYTDDTTLKFPHFHLSSTQQTFPPQQSSPGTQYPPSPSLSCIP